MADGKGGTLANLYLHIYPDGDIVVMDDFIYIKMKLSEDDLKAFDFTLGKYIGETVRTGVQNNWKKWDANILKIGTKIYQHVKIPNICIVVVDNKNIPYIQMYKVEVIIP